jgi:hypothetical protein
MTAALGVLAALATLACIASIARAHVLPTGYEPVRDPLGSYGVGPFAGSYVAAALALAVASAALAAGTALAGRGAREVALLAVLAVALLALTAFPADLEGERPSHPGQIHEGLVVGPRAAVCPAMSLDPAAPWLGWAASALAGLTLLALRLPRLRPWAGAIERVLAAVVLAWFGLVAVQLVS